MGRGVWVPAFAGTTKIILATQSARSFQNHPPSKTEGAGNAGCALHPRSRVRWYKRKCTRAYRAAENIRHSLRNGFTAYNALSPVSRGSVATVATQKTVLRNLTPAYGRQDHTSLPYALAPFVIGTTSVHRDPSQRS